MSIHATVFAAWLAGALAWFAWAMARHVRGDNAEFFKKAAAKHHLRGVSPVATFAFGAALWFVWPFVWPFVKTDEPTP